MSAVKDAARAAFMARLVAVPTRGDGSKAPALPYWAELKVRRPTDTEYREMWKGDSHAGLGVLASHEADAWDFDHEPTFRRFIEEARKELGDLFDRAVLGYCDETPKGGRRVLIRRPGDVPFEDVTLAQRPMPDGKAQVLIELPTHAILAPSTGRVHPSGKPYVRLSGDFGNIVTYTVEERDGLIALARRFDEMPRRERKPAASALNGEGTKPGDDYNRRTSWEELLTRHGWQSCRQHGDEVFWTRPGKGQGISASTNHAGLDLLHVFSSSTMFRPNESYSKFAAYALLEHCGDFQTAARTLRGQGYGTAPPTVATKGEPDGANDAPSTRPVLVRLDTVQPERVDYLWKLRLAKRKLTILAGEPGLGKSYATMDIAARVSKGLAWPDDSGNAPLGDVLLLTAEDGLADTVRPRLDALGGDPTRVHVLSGIIDREHERPFSLDRDLPRLESALDQTGALLVVIDPVSAYLGQADSYKDAEVRALLAPLARLAEKRGVAVLLVMHLRKSREGNALQRLSGSIGFGAAARIVLGVGRDEQDTERRLFAGVKTNLGKLPATLAYRFVGPEDAGWLEWEPGIVEGIDGERLLTSGPVDRDEHDSAAEFFDQVLPPGGEVPEREVSKQAGEWGISRSTLHRWKRRLGIDSRKGGLRDGWLWFRPLPVAGSASKVLTKVLMSPEVSTFGNDPMKSTENTGHAPKVLTSTPLEHLRGSDEYLRGPEPALPLPEPPIQREY